MVATALRADRSAPAAWFGCQAGGRQPPSGWAGRPTWTIWNRVPDCGRAVPVRVTTAGVRNPSSPGSPGRCAAARRPTVHKATPSTRCRSGAVESTPARRAARTPTESVRRACAAPARVAPGGGTSDRQGCQAESSGRRHRCASAARWRHRPACCLRPSGSAREGGERCRPNRFKPIRSQPTASGAAPRRSSWSSQAWPAAPVEQPPWRSQARASRGRFSGGWPVRRVRETGVSPCSSSGCWRCNSSSSCQSSSATRACQGVAAALQRPGPDPPARRRRAPRTSRVRRGVAVPALQALVVHVTALRQIEQRRVCEQRFQRGARRLATAWPGQCGCGR